MVSVEITEEYAYVAASLAFVGLVQLYLGSAVMGARKAFKKSEFLGNPKVQALQEEHKKAFGAEINNLGYPDMGSGVYSQLLPYADWVDFNNAQRSHYNMVEQSSTFCAAMAVVGVFYPRAVGASGFVFGIGRLLYAQGYRSKKGADGRLLGALTAELAVLGVYCAGFYLVYDRTNLVELIKAKLLG